MADERELTKAREVYEDLKALLDDMECHYEEDDTHADAGDFIIRFNVTGDDLPMSFIFLVDANRQLIRVMSPMPFNVPEDMRLMMAVAICVASRGLPDGSFDYDIMTGNIIFRQTVSFRKSDIGEVLFLYLLKWATNTVERYNDRLFAVAKGLMSLEDFIEAENN